MKLMEYLDESIRSVNTSYIRALSIDRTYTPFTVVRGVYFDVENEPSVGQIITYGIQRSASFNIETVLEGYNEDDESTGVMLIQIPSESILAYHPSEDQVIFPIGAKFLVTSPVRSVSVYAFGEYTDVLQYECTYIGAPDTPENEPLHTSIEYSFIAEDR